MRNSLTESSQKGSEGDGEWARDSHCITQHQVGVGGRTGYSAAHNTARQHQDWGLAGENITRGIHTQFSSGYKVWVREAESQHRGGIAIFWREEGDGRLKERVALIRRW